MDGDLVEQLKWSCVFKVRLRIITDERLSQAVSAAVNIFTDLVASDVKELKRKRASLWQEHYGETV